MPQTFRTRTFLVWVSSKASRARSGANLSICITCSSEYLIRSRSIAPLSEPPATRCHVSVSGMLVVAVRVTSPMKSPNADDICDVKPNAGYGGR